mmetsp:Transcript_29012/g.79869  ORF Transcript_29012/g.79869 Transcript_29012/m.79869 type:complete len:597 (-) Transcript_29012:1395-3185(-)
MFSARSAGLGNFLCRPGVLPVLVRDVQRVRDAVPDEHDQAQDLHGSVGPVHDNSHVEGQSDCHAQHGQHYEHGQHDVAMRERQGTKESAARAHCHGVEGAVYDGLLRFRADPQPRRVKDRARARRSFAFEVFQEGVPQYPVGHDSGRGRRVIGHADVEAHGGGLKVAGLVEPQLVAHKVPRTEVRPADESVQERPETHGANREELAALVQPASELVDPAGRGHDQEVWRVPSFLTSRKNVPLCARGVWPKRRVKLPAVLRRFPEQWAANFHLKPPDKGHVDHLGRRNQPPALRRRLSEIPRRQGPARVLVARGAVQSLEGVALGDGRRKQATARPRSGGDLHGGPGRWVERLDERVPAELAGRYPAEAVFLHVAILRVARRLHVEAQDRTSEERREAGSAALPMLLHHRREVPPPVHLGRVTRRDAAGIALYERISGVTLPDVAVPEGIREVFRAHEVARDFQAALVRVGLPDAIVALRVHQLARARRAAVRRSPTPSVIEVIDPDLAPMQGTIGRQRVVPQHAELDLSPGPQAHVVREVALQFPAVVLIVPRGEHLRHVALDLRLHRRPRHEDDRQEHGEHEQNPPTRNEQPGDV